MKNWNIYIAESVYTKKEDGNAYQNVLSLIKIDGTYKSFSAEVYPKIEAIKKDMIANGAWEGCLSRSEDYCVDHLTRYATEKDTVRDCMFPDFIGIDIISTPYKLKLVEA